jgi:hypothetical protein
MVPVAPLESVVVPSADLETPSVMQAHTRVVNKTDPALPLLPLPKMLVGEEGTGGPAEGNEGSSRELNVTLTPEPEELQENQGK